MLILLLNGYAGLSFYDESAPFLWGLVIGVLTAFLFTELASQPTLKTIAALAGFIAGALATKHLFENHSNATVFYYLLGLLIMWFLYYMYYVYLPALMRGASLLKKSRRRARAARRAATQNIHANP
jgi:hypothetical protein